MRTLLVILSAAVIPLAVGAQWKSQCPSQANKLYDVTIVEDSILVAAGSGSGLLRSNDNGASWSQVALLADGVEDAGRHEVRLDGSRLASGVYFYTLRTGGTVATRKLVLLR